MSKLGRELDFDALLRAYDDGLLGRLEFYYWLLIRAEGTDPEEYLARIPAEHRRGFEAS
ncbi:hypothetical protein [Sorangium sp. So ce1097]|uniref:hypothetical protein n=1 Tax=Sorangium sp. So ce1097 TaxID=3133330 RepID=UPI003F6018E9